jgi:hypothetical protein
MKKLNRTPINFSALQLFDGNILTIETEQFRKLVRLQNKELFRDLPPKQKTFVRLHKQAHNKKSYVEQLFFHAGAFHVQNVKVAKLKAKKNPFVETALNTVLSASSYIDRQIMLSKLARL